MKPKSNDYTSLMSAVAKAGPIVVNVDASKWHDYEEGIFGGCDYEENIDINHAVVLMGYGEDENGAYWLIRNSWGPEWGEQVLGAAWVLEDFYNLSTDQLILLPLLARVTSA